MDIESFNRELAKKVAIASSHEKHNEIKKAVEAWIIITEMTLKASKEPNIDSTYRTMLIKKTEQIVKHIKELKVKLAIPKPVREVEIPQEIVNNQEQDQFNLEHKSTPSTHKIIENSDNKEMPEGFLEIKTSDDFKILTPHKELDKSILKNAGKVYKLDSDTNDNDPNDDHRIILDQSGDNKSIICFACGATNPPNSKTCKSCKTDLV